MQRYATFTASATEWTLFNILSTNYLSTFKTIKTSCNTTLHGTLKHDVRDGFTRLQRRLDYIYNDLGLSILNKKSTLAGSEELCIFNILECSAPAHTPHFVSVESILLMTGQLSNAARYFHSSTYIGLSPVNSSLTKLMPWSKRWI